METSTFHSWLPYWLRLDGHDAPEDDADRLKKCLSALGVNSRTWKLYAEYGDGLLRPLGGRWLSPERSKDSLKNTIDYLHLLNGCEVDMAPPRALVAALAACIPHGRSIEAMPVAIFRGAWRALVHAGYRGITPKTFVEQEFIPVMQWVFEQGASLKLDVTRTKAGWSWLRNRWSEVRRRRTLPPELTEWAAPLLWRSWIEVTTIC